MSRKPSNSASLLKQLLVNFVIPIVILTRFSSEKFLGPTNGMLLALAFPVVFEIYNIRKTKKPNMLSVIAIVGILVTGAISLLGLSEGWLAVRRSFPYLVLSLAMVVSVRLRCPLLEILLAQIVDMDAVKKAAKNKNNSTTLTKAINVCSYFVGALGSILALVTYALTRIVIKSPTNTSGFNGEYAHLRILSIPTITLPLIIGVIVGVAYLLAKIEKLTDIKLDDLVKKTPKSQN